MENDNQIAVKKRLIYAEDLFEPVDFTVVQLGGRSGGKTMAMYEQLFRKRVEMAPTIDAVEVVRCKNCNHGITDEEEPGMCKCVESAEYDSESGIWLGFVEYHTPDFFCAYGERKD